MIFFPAIDIKDGKCISQDDNQLNDILLRLSLYNVTHHRN